MEGQIFAGFDPGLASCGWGIISVQGSRVRHIAHGVITTSAEDREETRLEKLFDEVDSVLSGYRPVGAGVESIFFSRNATSAIPVAQARGVILLACARNGLPVLSLSPPQIKQSITGVGRAEKAQIQTMIQFLLGLSEPPESDHAADALAAAYCLWQESPREFRGQ